MLPASSSRVFATCAISVRKVERHVDAGIRAPEQRAVEMRDERQMHLAVVPGGAELVGRDRDRRERARRLRLEEAEALRELAPE